MMLGEKSYAPDDFDAAGLPQRVSVRDRLGVLGGHFVVPHFDLLSQLSPERLHAWIAAWPEGCAGSASTRTPRSSKVLAAGTSAVAAAP